MTMTASSAQSPLLDVVRFLASEGLVIQQSAQIEDSTSACVSYDQYTFVDGACKKCQSDYFGISIKVKGPPVRRVDFRAKPDFAVGKAGMTIMIPPDDEGHFEGVGSFESLNFFIASSAVERLSLEVFDKPLANLEFQQGHFRYDATMMQIGGIVLERLFSGDLVTALEMDAWAQIVALHILRKYNLSDGLKRGLSGGRKEVLSGVALSRAKAYINSHLSIGPLFLRDIASSVGVSERRFARAFQEGTGSSVHEYVLQVKLSRACEMLRNSNMPLLEISVLSGFASQSHMTNVFRRRLRMTPREFRNALL
ncbi:MULTISPECIES: AraC family transcriptional regulator [Methylopilaceae]|uniref:AraC family transcriptional regulator n=2 Tax=Methylopilaceae TaxID=3149309 RepID=A0A4Q0MA52_9HYPH|nr:MULTISPECIES: AraC family transcriptional regulator [Methylocystaceae]QZO00565.1 AraC family transcriptional regulator [Chenggangzhangella methanolivorans]RXF69965.1 AraC family transcriptional regulator [Hansschlegelia zhihuaiae]